MPLSNPTVLACVGTLGYITYLFFAKRPRNGIPLPPGPPGLPFIGNLLDVPNNYMWLKFEEHCKNYGDVVSLRVLGKTMILVGSAEAASELFEKRSSIYSDRVRLPMIIDLMGWDRQFSLMRYGPQWREYRRVFHQHFNQLAVNKYEDIQARESRVFLCRLLENPEDFLDHIRLAFTTTIMEIVYGIAVTDKNDKFVAMSEDAIESLSVAGVPGAFLVDFLPILKHVPAWFPGAGFKRKAEEWSRVKDRFINEPFDATKVALHEGSMMRPSMASTLLQSLPEGNTEEAELRGRNVAAMAYIGGADTTTAAIRVLFLAMLTYPDVQKRAHAELDKVVGNSRLPDFSDRDQLPYIDALIKETLRWLPIAPLAIPHATAEDDVYNGYLIPKGSIVFGNAWSILHDPVAYPKPEEFKPERFLKDGKLNPEVRDPSVAVFGFGRRICPGRHFSDNAMYSLTSSLLSVFDIRPPLNERGEPVLVTPQMTSGLLSAPGPFKCTIKPRSKAAEALIRETQIDELLIG
ncbi:hypothetical protein JAAARDRAFT_415809 [Jaapia argillacea MUCL 33604]|uniref:Cytochrome P450 n=1 Tax=Jaapia argillacea MUCL 33604 TaxID=933084 RepID=A0A067PGG2_9AGAM|nr:hypothetical protein JAAARDRAFT_415809 [Jaapia argillacea MUCL 33604]